jgi:DNA repair protein RadA/Sms
MKHLPRQEQPMNATSTATVRRLSEISESEIFSTGTRVLDRVLGNGIVHGSAIYLSGEPGIGKSTLALQAAIDLANATIVVDGNAAESLTVLYVTTRESPPHVKGRAERLKAAEDNGQLYVVHTHSAFEVERVTALHHPDITFIDAFDDMVCEGIDCAEVFLGSRPAVRLGFFTDLSKRFSGSMFLLSHTPPVAHSFMLAMLDVWLQLERDSKSDIRTIRAMKNRYGMDARGSLRLFEGGFASVDGESRT